MKCYLANGLFSISSRMFNEHIANQLRTNIENIKLYLPQENESINDKNSFANSEMIAKADTDELLNSDVLIAVLDGDTIDAGVASEIGVFYTTGKPIIALYSDVRQFGASNKDKLLALREVGENQFHYINLYTSGLIKLSGGKIVNNINDLVKEVKNIGAK